MLKRCTAQIHRLVSAEVDGASGLVTLKGFTAALVNCCSDSSQLERLFRSIRGEGGRRRCTSDYGGSPGSWEPTRAGVPSFVTQLSAYRRKVGAFT